MSKFVRFYEIFDKAGLFDAMVDHNIKEGEQLLFIELSAKEQSEYKYSLFYEKTVTFDPDNKELLEKLDEIASGEYTFIAAKNQKSEVSCLFLFKNKNDPLMFKLTIDATK